jgi:hypothetical protein
MSSAVALSAANAMLCRVPPARASPPYCVMRSSLLSACRWSCFRRTLPAVRVKTQVRDRSSPT